MAAVSLTLTGVYILCLMPLPAQSQTVKMAQANFDVTSHNKHINHPNTGGRSQGCYRCSHTNIDLTFLKMTPASETAQNSAAIIQKVVDGT